MDTGLTIDKVKLISAREYTKRRDEIFFRINKHQLNELYSEYEVDEYEDIAETMSSSGPKIITYSETSRPSNTKPYLILDVRDTEEFQKYHLVQARTFPYVMLRRDQVHSELYNFRNKQGHLIIIVDDDERIAQEAAKVLVDRGCDNVYLLTGGILEFSSEYPSYVEGNCPSPKNSPKKSSASTRLTGKSISNITCDLRTEALFLAQSDSHLSEAKLAAHNSRSPRDAKDGALTSRSSKSTVLKTSSHTPSAAATALSAMRRARDQEDTVSTRSIASKGGRSTTSNASGSIIIVPFFSFLLNFN